MPAGYDSVTQTGRPTMRDVAALAGVAVKTVSRVINEVPTVDPALAGRVHAAADKLGYRPNLAASNLRSGRTDTIGLLLEDVSNPFSAAVHRAIEDYVRDRGILLLTASLDEDPTRERQLVSRLIDRRVDGLVVVPTAEDHRYIVAEQGRGTSVVFVDRQPRPLVADAVVTNNRDAACHAVTQLVAGGHRRIAYLGDAQTITTAADRYLGYLDAHAKRRLRPLPSLTRHGLRTADAARNAALELLAARHPPDAFFTSQNLVTIGTVQALHHTGRQHDIALIGFDDVPFAATFHPGITVIAQDTAGIGRTAAERVLARIGGDRSPAKLYVVDSIFIPRGSGEIQPPGTL
jgi:LacI family transcriptional regulator